MLLLTTLLGCAGVQIDLHGWPAYVTPPVAMTDEQLADNATELEFVAIRQRLARCQARWGTCRTEVRVLRNRHEGDGHLSLPQIASALDAAGVGTPKLTELVDHHTGDHGACWVLVRMLPSD